MYSKIYNQLSGNYVNINSKLGKQLLYNYVQYGGDNIIYTFQNTINDIEYRYYTKNNDLEYYPDRDELIKIDKSSNLLWTHINNPISKSKKRSLLIKGSFTDFSLENTLGLEDSLHVGISNSENKIYNFWNSYLIDKSSDWEHCLVVPLESDLTDSKWDKVLHIEMKKSSKEHTDYKFLSTSSSRTQLEDKNDCFSYAIRLLNSLNYGGKNNHDLLELAGDLIQPKIEELKFLQRVWEALKTIDYVRIKI